MKDIPHIADSVGRRVPAHNPPHSMLKPVHPSPQPSRLHGLVEFGFLGLVDLGFGFGLKGCSVSSRDRGLIIDKGSYHIPQLEWIETDLVKTFKAQLSVGSVKMTFSSMSTRH